MNFLRQALILAYAGVGIIAAIGYWPTIKDLAFHGKASANTLSYALWTLTSGIALLYSLFILGDWLFRFVSFVNFALCLIILLLRLRLPR